MGDVRFPDKPSSNSYDHIYGENEGNVVRIPKDKLSIGYDLVLKSSVNPLDGVSVENLSIVSGTAWTVFEKCVVDNKLPKVLLLFEHEYDGIVTQTFCETTNIKVLNEEMFRLEIAFRYSESGGGSTEFSIRFDGSTSIYNSTIDAIINLQSADTIIEVEYGSNFGWIPKEGYAYNKYAMYEMFKRVQAGEDVSILIKANCTLDSGSTKYKTQIHPVFITEYGNQLWVCFLYPAWMDAGGRITLVFAIDASDGSATLQYVRKGNFAQEAANV